MTPAHRPPAGPHGPPVPSPTGSYPSTRVPGRGPADLGGGPGDLGGGSGDGSVKRS